MAQQWLIYLQSLPWLMVARVAVAMLLGGVIGFEREWSGHTAGLRTTILVSVGASLFTIISIVGFPVHGSTQDTGRVAAQIVSGVGFLGAGVLFLQQNQVKGLTTAATIWLVAAIGMAAGAGMFFIATFTTILTIIVLVLLKPIDDRLQRRRLHERTRPSPAAMRTAIRQPGVGATEKRHGDE